MKALVIAEKPSVARDIARVLKCGKSQNGVIEGGDYIVTWGLGHLVTLADPENYDPKYKQWRMEDLPVMPDSFKLEVIRQTGKQYQTVKNQIHRQDVKEIIIATDAGREGELVARLILIKAGNKKPVRRLWISSVTDKAIREGFAHLKDGKEYEFLYEAAVCRAEADWLVGMNATRALTCKYNASLSCGRVQTPTLAIIEKREKEIRSFVPKSYYGIAARSSEPLLDLAWCEEKTGNTRCFDRTRIEALTAVLKGREAVVTDVLKVPEKTLPPLLYDLTELQKDANKRFDYSAKETLNIMQRLYENHKVLTYPRTDSRYISSDIVPTLKERLKAVGVGPYRSLAGRLLKADITANAHFVNDNKVSDHHAIIPTEEYVDLSHMTVEERRIYDLVVRRFLAVMYPPLQFEQTSVKVKIGTETFTAKGKIVNNQGWKEVYGDDTEDEGEEYGNQNVDLAGEEKHSRQVKSQKLPALKKGDRIAAPHIVITEGKTAPPPAFNEASLLSAMENPAAYMDSLDKEMAKTLGETGGLGTVATRADIIEKLFSGFLLEKRGKEIHLTLKAKQLLSLVPGDLKKPELTAKWEMNLSRIAKGDLNRNTFMKEIRSCCVSLVEEIRTGSGTFCHENVTGTKCPRCGKLMLSVKGKNSEMLVCQDRECGYRETISRVSNARCPVCHKKLELKGKAEAQIFVCRCGYKEKLPAFLERRKKEGAGVSKRDVASYMNQQQKESESAGNSVFAEAFAKLKLDR